MTQQKEKRVILVNSRDQIIGEEEKLIAHRYAMLHRAFSVFIFRHNGDRQEVLLQQRSSKKYHCGGLLSNACCSHPTLKGPSLQKTAEIRLKEEMGLTVPLQKKGVFHYVAAFNNGLYENEIDHVFTGFYNDMPVQFNPEEVDAYHWIELGLLQEDLFQKPQKYTPWLSQALRIALD